MCAAAEFVGIFVLDVRQPLSDELRLFGQRFLSEFQNSDRADGLTVLLSKERHRAFAMASSRDVVSVTTSISAAIASLTIFSTRSICSGVIASGWVKSKRRCVGRDE